MRDEPNLLAGILANPDDDAPRLVYADWLDENGQPDRAEFIRVQIERARTPHWHPKRPGLDRRNRDLIGEFQLEWAKPLLDMGLPSWEYRRGFLEHAEMDAQQFIRDGDELVRTTMVRSVQANGDADYEALCSMRAFEQMHAWCTADGDDFVHHMAKCDGDLALRSLVFRNAGLSDASFDELANLPVPYLHTLDLGRASIDAGAMKEFARSSLSRQLSTLLVDGVASDVAAFLERAKLPALRHLAVDVDTLRRLFARPKSGLAVPCLASLRSLSIGLDPRPQEFDWSVLAWLPALRWLGLGILVLNDAPLRAFVQNLNMRVINELVLLRHQVLDEAALRRGYRHDHSATFVLDVDLRITNQDEWFEEMGFNSPNATVTLRGFGDDQTLMDGAWPPLVNTSDYFWELENKTKTRELQRIVIHDSPNLRYAELGLIPAGWPSFLPQGLPQAQQRYVAFDGCVEWPERVRHAVCDNGRRFLFREAAVSEDEWEQLVNNPVFSNVRELTMGYAIPIAAFVRLLLASPYISRLQRLEISDSPDGDTVTQLVAASPPPRLQSLWLADSNVTTKGVQALASSPHLRRLTGLHLRGAIIDKQAARALAESPNLETLRAINLWHTEFDDAAAWVLAESRHLRWLVELYVCDNPLGTDGLDVLRARFGAALIADRQTPFSAGEPVLDDLTI